MAESTSNSGDERAALMKMLADGQQAYLACLSKLSEEMASLRRDDSSWTILECAEHVAVAEGQMLRLWEKLAVPGTTERATDQAVSDAASNRQRKAQAPERSRPSGRFASLAEAREKFVHNRQASIEKLQQMGDELRSKAVPHPLVGLVDGYQLFLIMALHPARHAAQIEEIVGTRRRAAGR
jgi:hypothetical protein